MPDSRPNIILIVADQWRGDCLSIDGHPVVHTPHLDQMALDGVRFNHAYTACPSCIPARAALFTGLTQESHGRVGYKDGVDWDYPVTLAGELTAAGYQTQAIGKMHVYPERSQMGFQNVILHDGYLHFSRRKHAHAPEMVDDYLPWLRREVGPRADYFDHGVNCNSMVARPWDKEEYLHPTNWAVGEAIDFLRRRDPRKPFFLFLSFHRPHPPLDPPAWAFEQYIHREMPDVPVGDWVGHFDAWRDPYRHDLSVGPIDREVLRRARAAYYGQLTAIDHQLNRFFEALADWSVLDESYVLFTADHGELLGDHHLHRKTVPYEGSARIPFLLRAPRSAGLARGSVCEEPVELMDVMPTLLDIAGAPIPSTVEGRSCLPLARGERVPWREYLHGEHTYQGNQSVQYLTDGRKKYVWFSGDGTEQYFDLVADPQELHDLAREERCRDEVAMWRARLVEALAGREEGFTDGKALVPGRPVSPCLRSVFG
jgi:arylsulfatase